MNTSHPPVIDRRRFLRGLGMALALPAFESLNVGFAATAPKSDPRRLICIGNHLGFWPDGFFPTAQGRDYAISQTLAPLAAHRGNFTIFSHLDHNSKGGHGAVHSFLTGVKKEEAAGFPEKNISIDQVAAEHVGAATRYPSITAGIGEGTDMCWNRAGVRIPPVNNPARLFDALFVEASGSAKAAERERLSHLTWAVRLLHVVFLRTRCEAKQIVRVGQTQIFPDLLGENRQRAADVLHVGVDAGAGKRVLCGVSGVLVRGHLKRGE